MSRVVTISIVRLTISNGDHSLRRTSERSSLPPVSWFDWFAVEETRAQ
jgi:hypothetical protein